VPTSALPKRCRCGSTVGQETHVMGVHRGESEDDVMDEMGERGHILWIRGLSRLQHQVNRRETARCAVISRMFIQSFNANN